MKVSRNDIERLPRIKRLNLINSITGIKPANLLGTKNLENNICNLSIISSVVHLGSDPSLMGFILRPQLPGPKDSYLNIMSNKTFTLNQVPKFMIENAHYTSAKFPPEISEFERCGFTEEYLEGFNTPFVRESTLKIGLTYEDEKFIKQNNTRLIIGKVEWILFDDQALDEDYTLNLEKLENVGIGGVNTYYNVSRISSFPYAHLKSVPNNICKK